MPLVGTFGQATQHFISPRVGTTSSTLAAPAMSDEQKQQMTQKLFNTKYSENKGLNFIQKIGGYAATAPIDLADSLLANNLLPLSDRGDVWNFVGDYGGEIGTKLESFYARNQSTVATISGVGGAIGTAYLGSTLLLPRISSALAGSTMISGSKLWQYGARANALTRTKMLDAQAAAAASGEAFKMWGNVASRAYLGNRAARLGGIAAFEEGLIAATMNGNEAIWADELSENLLWAGLGVGLGGALGSIGARSEMRKLANSPDMIRARADAIDPQGFTHMREFQPSKDYLDVMKNTEVLESATFTSLMLDARQAVPKDATPEIASRFETLRANTERQAFESLQKIASKGSPGIPNSSFRVADSAGEHIKALTHNDPTAMFGLDTLSGLKDKTLNDALEARRGYIQELKDSEMAGSIQQARHLEEQQPLVLIHEQWLPAGAAESMAFSHYRPSRMEFKQIKGTNEYRFRTESGRVRKVDESFDVKEISSLPINERMQVIEASNHLFRGMKAGMKTAVLPEKHSWFQIDSMLEFEKRGGSVDWSKSGLMNREAAELKSLALKADATEGINLGSVWERQAYNLPIPNSFERIYDAAGDSIRAVLQGAKDGMNLGELKNLYAEIRQMDGFALRTEKETSLTGDIFNFNRDESGKWRESVLGFFQNEQVMKPLSRRAIAEQIAENKAARFHTLTSGQSQGGMVPALTMQMHQSPEFVRAMNVRGLADDQITGVGNATSQTIGEVLTREMRYRDNETILNAFRMREGVNRASDAHLTQILSQELGDVIPRLNASPAAKSKVLVNQFASNSQGWDLRKELVPLNDGMYGFALSPTARNEQRVGHAIDPETVEDLLVNPRTGAPIVVDELGAEFLGRFQNVTSRILADKNRLRVAMNLQPLRKKEWYVPPRDTRNMHLGFTFDEFGQAVPGGAIMAKTQDEFERLRAVKMKSLPKGHTFRTREQVAETADLWDRAAMDWIDPGVGAAPSRGQTGALSSDTVNPNAVSDMLGWTKRQVEQIGTNTVRVLFDSQLGIVRARGATEHAIRGMKPKGRLAKTMDEKTRTIYDEYEATLLGKNLGDMERSISGSITHPIESFINTGIATAWPAMKWMAPSHLGQWLGDLAGQLGVKKFQPARTFAALSEQLGPYSPYKNAQDYAEQTLKVVVPPEIRQISEKINWFSSAVLLRAFEIAHPAMNLLGVITTMPSIIQSGRAPISASFDVKGKRLNIIDATRILADSAGDLLRKDRRADWEYMVTNGDTTQQVAEFNKQLSLVQDQSTFKRVMFGTSDAKGKKGPAGIFEEKGIDGLISVLTDKSENFSRSWSHFVGLRLADMNGIVGMEARHNFAREIANAGIANYNPMNRPELFQSAFGSMFGLFMSWMQNYNQRLFRWMETGDYGSIGRQLGMQTALFGVASNPGYSYLESILLATGMGTTEDGREATVLDNIYARFGPELGSAIAHGGLQEFGIVLYTRGDMNYRDVTLDPTRLAAGIGVTTSGISAVKEAVTSLLSEYSLEDSGRLQEIAARHMPNRMLKGVLTSVLNDGLDIDSRGQIVSENRDFFDTAVRMTGLRTTRQQAEIEAFYSNRRLQDREAARMDILRAETRSLIRQPGWENQLQSVFDKYVKAGGTPAHFRTWVKDQVRSATGSRGMNDLTRAMRNEKNQSEVWRYNLYGATD